MSYTCLSCGSATLQVAAAPAILNRPDARGPAIFVDVGLDGTPVVTQFPRGSSAPVQSELRLRFAPLSSSQMANLDSVLSTGGVISVYTSSGASAISCVAAPRKEQVIKPLVLPYGDEAIGGALPDRLMQWEAEIVLIRLS